ncbi:MAG: isocitrate lyase/phosphoenolpyruvate mutase family protein [Acidobacteriota bacterium]|nr:isocitrate lyase/phosphoenolpyruvate mutase family protein [Acidobacteriota bacterium]
MVRNQKDKADDFRSLHVAGDPLVLYNIWDAGSAKAVAAGGAKAIATGSWSVASANGFADGERIPFDLVIANLRRIVEATELPVSVDLESGYGKDVVAVGRTIAAAIEAGAIGCNLEDSFPDSGAMRETAEQVERIARARQTADDAGIAFFLNARTDVFLRSPRASHDKAMVDTAIERGRAYAGSGADGLFLPGLVDPALIEYAVHGSPLPVNIMVADSTSTPALAAIGVARISYGPSPWIALMKVLEDAARAANHSR